MSVMSTRTCERAISTTCKIFIVGQNYWTIGAGTEIGFWLKGGILDGIERNVAISRTERTEHEHRVEHYSLYCRVRSNLSNSQASLYMFTLTWDISVVLPQPSELATVLQNTSPTEQYRVNRVTRRDDLTSNDGILPEILYLCFR
jgi:hypothetical protein